MDAWKSLSAEKNLLAGNLKEALAELQEKVRADPANPKLRVFLFQLLSILGDWERAHTQLSVAGEMDAANLAMASVYRDALTCEALRGEIFAGLRSPLVFGDPEGWIALLLESLKAAAAGKYDQVRELRDRAFEEAPTTSGRIDGKEFSWIADADPRIGPVLEAVVLGRYYWVPFKRIREIRLEGPTDLRDVVWTAAQFTWANGGQTVGLIPTRYAGSEKSEDPKIRLAKRTDWIEQGPDLFVGLGQRMFATDTGEHSLLDARLIALDTGTADEGLPEGANG